MRRRVLAAAAGLVLGILPVTAGNADSPPEVEPPEVAATCVAEPFGAGHGGVWGGPTLGGAVSFGASAECVGSGLDSIEAQLLYSDSGINFLPTGHVCSGPATRVGTFAGATNACAIASLDKGYYGVSAVACATNGECFESIVVVVAAPVDRDTGESS